MPKNVITYLTLQRSIHSTLFTLVLLISAGSLFGGDFEVQRAIPASDPELNGLQLIVFSAQTKDSPEPTIDLRIGILNSSPNTVSASLALDESAIHLMRNDVLSRPSPTVLSPALLNPIPHTGLSSRDGTRGLLSFPHPEGRGPYNLQVTGFPDLEFELPPERTFSSPVLPAEGISLPLNLELKSNHPAVGAIQWNIGEIRIAPDGFRIRTSFTNTSSKPVSNPGHITGYGARLLDHEGAIWNPNKVTDQLADGIGPAGASWPAGEQTGGLITFPTPHPHALRTLRLLLPQFPPLQLRYDHPKKTFLATIGQGLAPVDIAPAAVGINHDAEAKAIASTLATLGTQFTRPNPAPVLDTFTSRRGAKARATTFLRQLRNVPVRAIALAPLPAQPFQVSGSGAVRELLVSMRYVLHGTPEDNEFISILRVDLQRSPDGAWQIDDFVFAKHPPFWTLGYTALEATPHFLLFYDAATTSPELVAQTANQAEASYRELDALGFKLENRYPAFFIAKDTNFRALTGRDPQKFGGVASAIYEPRNGILYPVNRAMYINDSRLLTHQSLAQMKGRGQTITHELVHLALARHTRPFTPAWLVEGVAVHYASQNNEATRRALLATGALGAITLSDLSHSVILGKPTDSKEFIGQQYSLCGETIAYLSGRYGAAKVMELYHSFGALSVDQLKAFAEYPQFVSSGGELDADAITFALTKRLLPRIFGGLTLEQLDTDVKRWLQQSNR